MENKHLVTIGIPVFNEENHIAETIESALNQSYKNIRILISDNCSTDKSNEIIKKYADANSNISYVRQNELITAYSNFKHLLDNAQSDYFFWLGGHDKIAKGYVEDAMEKFSKDKELVCVFAKASVLLLNGEIQTNVHDDLETSGMNITYRLEKITQKVYYGSAVYSVYKTNILRKSFYNINGGDLLIMFIASYFGTFTSSSDTSYYFRQVRIENPNETQARYEKHGFAKNWDLQRVMLPYFVLVTKFKLPFFQKMEIINKIQKPLNRFYSFSRKNVFKYYIFNKFKPIVSIFILINLLHNFFRTKK